jgi:cell fate regulator YaaT (PSP1 superfamily)
MPRVVRVEFAGPARHQYSPAPGYTLRAGDVVVLETDWGVGIGHVGSILEDIPLDALKPPVRRILRKATPTDLSRRASLLQREREVRAFCLERIRARGLLMKLTEVRIGLDSSKAMFYFTADGRVDFRELVKDLTQHLRTRVELRQIGVRDEARVLGSSGPCGRSLCCHAFLQAFAPVSIRMAKDQNLALNPGKLSGMCGRLKCCLAFEHPLYAELKRTLPRVGCWVATGQGPGLVRTQNILKQTVLVGLETGGQITLKPTEITILPRPTPPARRQRTGQAPLDATSAESAPGGRRTAGRAGGPDRTAPDAMAAGPAESGPETQEPSHEADDVSPDVAALEDP